MNLKSIIYTLAFSSFLLSNLYSRQFQLSDSLKQELIKCENPADSVSLLCRIAWYSINDSDKLYYGQLALKTSEKVMDKALIADAHDAAALGYWTNNDRQKAKKYYRMALMMGEEINNYKRAGWSSFNLACIALWEKDEINLNKYSNKARQYFYQTKDYKMAMRCSFLLSPIYLNEVNRDIFDSVIKDLKNCIAETEDLNEQYQFYVLLSSFYKHHGYNKQSLNYAQSAMNLAEKTGNTQWLKEIYYIIADYFRENQKIYETALTYYNKILEIEKNNNNKIGISQAFLEIGRVYELMGNDSLALEYSYKSLEISTSQNHQHTIIQAYKQLGEINYNVKDHNKALFYFFKIPDKGCPHCHPISYHYILVDIGNTYLALKDSNNALKYYQKSLTLADSLNEKYQIAVSHANLAKYYEVQGNSKLAITYYLKAFGYTRSLNAIYDELPEIPGKLSRLYAGMNDFKNAYYYSQLSKQISDSLEIINKADNLAMFETRFEFQNLQMQKELDKAKLDDEIARQKLVKNFLIIGIFLAGFIGFLLYLGYRRKKKDNSILDEQKRTIEQMSEKVHEADQKRLRFFTNVSHEFRTPLILIFGPVEKLIKMHSNQDESITLLKIIKRNTKGLYHLISQLLDIRKLDTGDVNLKVRSEDIVNYSKGIYSSYSHFAEEKSINYTFSSENEKLTGWFDKDILEKVLNNLLSNAFKHTNRKGKINLSVFPVKKEGEENSHVQIQVSDNGVGIPEGQVQYVFDRYYRVENTNSGFNTGTGIGLAYTKELIELHKGQIHAESKLGEGTSFTIILPVGSSYYTECEKLKPEKIKNKPEAEKIEQEYLVQNIEMEAEVIPDEQQGFETEKEQVMLIVEDNADLRLFLRSIFEKEFIFHEAPDGNKGYKMAHELIPDIIISDIMMPEMDGLELCNQLKNNIHTNHIPILFLTAKAGDDNELEGLRTGAIDYIGKPFDADILFARIHSLLAHKRALGEYFKREYILNPGEVSLISPDDTFLKKAVKIVEDNIMNPELNVEMLVRELGVSRRQLYRKIQAITNFPVNLFIRNIKLKRAAQLLRQDSLNMSEVLYQSGFSNHTHFKNCFKELFGCLPKEYVSHSKINY